MASSVPKKRIRVSRKPKASRNPLFEKWLQEMKDEAERKDLKTKFAYAKALKSLQKYPLRLHSGKECKVLQHFGTVLCQQLDNKLEKYLADGGVLEESDGFSSDDVPVPPPKASRKSAAQKNPSSRERDYIPARRSGAYALLLALHKHSGSKGYLSKTVLLEAAQPYADVSFTAKSVVDSQYYTAWSSMGTLIKKELVEKTGNPAKYQLTDSGQILAIRLETAEAELGGSPTMGYVGFNAASPSPSPSKPSTSRVVKKATIPKATSNQTDPIVVPSASSLKRPIPNKTPTKSTQSVDDVILVDDDEFDLYPLMTPNFGEGASAASNKPSTTRNHISQLSEKTSVKDKPNSVSTKTSVPHQNPSTSKEICDGPSRDIIFLDQDYEFVRPPVSHHPPNKRTASTSSDPAMDEIIFGEEAEARAEALLRAPSYTHDSIKLKPGQYDIVLCVDNAEVAGSKHKETALKAFQNCGVPTDFRKLAVGDYLWICKPRPGSGLNPDNELILPYVVERKRLDDLVQSIKDGRFKEQKFRMVNSGLPRPIYLVEEFGNRQNLGIPEASMMQAIANTLMIEKFQVHWTKSSNESVAFLVEMTKQCAQIYKDKIVTSRSYRENAGADWQSRLVTFKEYYVNSTKQKPVSVTQMLAKHLMQLSGLSVEKSEAIVKSYPTLKSLMGAYRAAGSSSSQLLANLEYGKTGKAKRKIGSAVSGTIAMLYTQRDFGTM